jgi:hypothetical protein
VADRAQPKQPQRRPTDRDRHNRPRRRARSLRLDRGRRPVGDPACIYGRPPVSTSTRAVGGKRGIRAHRAQKDTRSAPPCPRSGSYFRPNRGHRRRARVGRGNPAGRTVDGTSGQGDGIYGRPPVPSSMVVSVTAKPTGWTRHSQARRRSSRGTGSSPRCGKSSSQPTRSSRLPSRSLPPTHVRRPRSESRKPGARNGVGCPADDPSGCSPNSLWSAACQ